MLQKECHLQKFLLQKRNHSIYLVNFFFQILAVIFMEQFTGIATCNFFIRTFKSHKEKIFCLHLLKPWKPDRNLQNNAAKVLATFSTNIQLFTKTQALNIMKTKTVFVNPHEHEY